MELLLILVADLLIPPFLMAVALVVELGLSVVQVLGELAFILWARRRRVSGPVAPGRDPPRAVLRHRKVRRGLLGVSLSLAVIIVAGNWLLVGPLVRGALARLGEDGDLEVTAGEIEGSLLTGRVELGGVEVRSRGAGGIEADLTAERFVVDVDMPFVFGTFSLDEVRVQGVRGSVTRQRKRPAGKPGRRSFEVERLIVEDTSVRVGDRAGRSDLDVTVTVEHLETAPLRSELALFDALYRTNASGSLGGVPFRAETREVDGGRETAWSARDVPIGFVAGHLGPLGPLLEDGKIDVNITDRWSLASGVPTISMDYDLVLHDLTLPAPEGLPLRTRTALAPVRTALKKLGRIPVSFRVELDENDLRYATGTDDLSAGAAPALLRAFADGLGVSPGMLEIAVKVAGAL